MPRNSSSRERAEIHRFGIARVGLFIGAAAIVAVLATTAGVTGCGSRGSSASSSSSGDRASSGSTAKSTATIGTHGGSLALGGTTLVVPEGALSSPVQITITEATASPPAGFVGTAVYRFAPEGLVFAKPATISFESHGDVATTASVYWSRTDGPGYEALSTQWTGTRASAPLAHFSSGFLGTAVAAQDGETVDADVADAVDAGVTHVTGLVANGLSNRAVSLRLTVDETSSTGPGCAQAIASGHRETTIPRAGYPYLYRYDFPVGDTSCPTRRYDAVMRQYDDAGAEIGSGTNACTGDAGTAVSCPVEMTFVPEPIDAGVADAAPADAAADAMTVLMSTLTVTGTITGTVPAGASWIRVDMKESDHIDSGYGCLGTSDGGGYTYFLPSFPLDFTFSLPPPQALPMGSKLCSRHLSLVISGATGDYLPMLGQKYVTCPNPTSTTIRCDATFP